MKLHAASSLFPMISVDEFAALKLDIEQHGQREPILVVDGALVDGRNRLRACKELGVEPIVRTLTKSEAGDVHALVMSLNFHRRHLRPHEKGAALAAYMQRVGAKKQAGPGRPKKSTTSVDLPPTIATVAKTLGVPEQTARDHLRAAEDYASLPAPLKQQVDAGEVTPKQARAKSEGAKPKQQQSKPKQSARSERDTLDDCIDRIEAAIRAALETWPSLRKAIAARIQMIDKRLTR